MVLAAQAHGLISILLIRHKVKMKTFKKLLSEIKTIETKKLTGKDRPYTGKPNYGGEPKAPNVNAKKKSVKEEVEQVDEVSAKAKRKHAAERAEIERDYRQRPMTSSPKYKKDGTKTRDMWDGGYEEGRSKKRT